MKFSAYPEQGIPRWHKQWLTLALVGSGVMFLMYAGTSSRPVNSNELKNIDYVQPILSSSGFEMGIWTGRPRSGRDVDGAPVATSEGSGAADKVAAVASQSERDPLHTIAQLTEELEAKRATVEDQQLEISRLRQRLELERTRSRETHGAQIAGPNQSPEEQQEAPADSAGWRVPPEPEPAPERSAGLRATTTQAARTTSSVMIPDSLWRQPPAQAEVPVTNNHSTQVSATESAGEVGASGVALGKGQAGQEDAGGNRVVLKAGSTDIVINIGAPASSKEQKEQVQDQKPAQQLAERPAQVTQQSRHAEPRAANDEEKGEGEEQEKSDSAPTPVQQYLDQPLATPAPLPPAKSSGDDGSITVRTGDKQISVKIGKSSSDDLDGADRASKPASTPKDSDLPRATPTTTLVPALPTSTTEGPALRGSVIANRSAHVEPASAASTQSSKDQEPTSETGQKRTGTSITVESQGQSITIQIGGSDKQDSEKQAAAVAAPPPREHPADAAGAVGAAGDPVSAAASKDTNASVNEDASKSQSAQKSDEAPSKEATREKANVENEALDTPVFTGAAAPLASGVTSTSQPKNLYANLAMRAR
jgi:hypothetical protein